MRKIIFILTLVAFLPLSLSATNWVKLDATNFPDKYFRGVLKAKAGTSNYNSSTNEINADAFTELNLTGTTSDKGDNQPRMIQSLEGIQLLRTLQKLTLLSPTSKNAKTAIKSIDVSGMPYLTRIDNVAKGSRGWPYVLTGSTEVSIKSEVTIASGFTMSNDLTVIANDCPKLTYVNLAGYNRLVHFECAGSTKITDLYLFKTGIRELDISMLTELKNTSMNGVWTDKQFTTNNISGMTDYRHFSLAHCDNLTSITLGNSPLHYLDLSYCHKLKEVDISGMPNILRFHAVMSLPSNDLAPEYNVTNKFSDNGHTHRFRSTGILETIIFPEDSKLYELTATRGCIQNIDLSNVGKTLGSINLSFNKLRSFDMSLIKQATHIDVGYNRIDKLGMPPKTCTNLSITDNCLTWYGQLYNGGYTKINCLNPYQYKRVGKVFRHKILENPEDAQYIELEDDPNSQKYYYGINGNELSGRIHLGDPTVDEKDFDGNLTGRKEDPCYVYFENDFIDAVYFYRNPTNSNNHFVHGWMKVYLCRGEDVDYDPRNLEYYLAGDFNNWMPTERDKFIYNSEDDRYYLDYNDDSLIERHFRVWGIDPQNTGIHNNRKVHDASYVTTSVSPAEGQSFYTVNDVTVDYGSHENDYNNFTGVDNHVLFTHNIYHKMNDDLTRHYTSYAVNNPDPNVRYGFKNASFEMKADEKNSPDNYLLMSKNTPTGVDGITVDGSDSEAPVEYFDLQGRRTDATLPGIYIRRQGTTTTKVAVH